MRAYDTTSTTSTYEAHYAAYWQDDAVRDRATKFIDSIIAINVRYEMGRCDEATRQHAIELEVQRIRAKNVWWRTR